MTDGSIDFLGERIDKLRAENIAKMGIVQVIEGRRVFEHLTVEQNLKVGAHMRKPESRSIKDGLEMVYHYFPRLKEKRNETAGFISGGEQQMTVVGRALNVAPHAYVMENGRIVMDDTAEKLRQNPEIKDFYLGLKDVGGRKSFRDVKHYKRRKRWLT